MGNLNPYYNESFVFSLEQECLRVILSTQYLDGMNSLISNTDTESLQFTILYFPSFDPSPDMRGFIFYIFIRSISLSDENLHVPQSIPKLTLFTVFTLTHFCLSLQIPMWKSSSWTEREKESEKRKKLQLKWGTWIPIIMRVLYL